MELTLPDLPYSFDALEPHIDRKTMEIHHGKHHAGYTNKINEALEGHEELKNKTIEEILIDLDSIPEDIRVAIQNNGGGFANHSLFWEILSPEGGGNPTDGVRDLIHQQWASYEAFKDEFSKTALSRFGSGWAWLVVDKDKKLHIYSTANQDSPYSQGHVPILGLDVWEHAYYLHYQNKRADYVEAFWNLINWEKVNENLEKAFT